MKTLAFLSVAALAACGACPGVTPAERIVTQTVQVPVPVARHAPPEVLQCWSQMPPEPTYRDAPGGLLLPLDQVPILEASEAAKRHCDDLWRAWESQP
ncbi:MAG: hypothetical protein QJR02_07140 [Sinobacteraceae bacterium]|nr:hypothetical protein [Nevskiaceae bacterium]